MIGSTLSDWAAVSNEGIKVDAGAWPMSGLNMMAARFRPGAISESNSSHLPPIGHVHCVRWFLVEAGKLRVDLLNCARFQDKQFVPKRRRDVVRVW
jgi:hypothetical protein